MIEEEKHMLKQDSASDDEAQSRSPERAEAARELLELHDNEIVDEEEERNAVFEFFVDQEKNLRLSLDPFTRRNTVVDTIIRKQCYTCNSLMPPYVHHCSTCGHCVVFMDHHCPWVNNCVGFYNQKLFFLFNFYGLITLTYSVVALTRNFVFSVFGVEGDLKEITVVETAIAASLFAVYLGFLFILVVFCDQVTIILNRMQMIDRINLESKRITELEVRRRGYANFKFTFGGPFGLRWFLPIPPSQALAVEELYN